MRGTNDRFSFEDAGTALYRLEGMLKQHGIAIVEGSLLEQAAYATLAIIEKQTSTSHDPRLEMVRLVGVAELGHQLYRNRASPHFHKLVPHLRLLSEKTTAAIQVGVSSPIDQETNKIFELLTACWVLPLVSDIELDDPEVSAGGTNPDIIATVGGVRWGIACKVLHSRTPQQIISTVEKGVSQIEASDVDRGVVIVSMKNHLDVNDYWPLSNPGATSDPNPEFDCFIDENTPFDMLRHQLADFVREAKHAAGLAALEDVLLRPRIVPAIAMWGHTVSLVVHDGHSVATSVRSLLVAPVSDEPSKSLPAQDRAFLEALNDNAMSNAEP